MRAPNLAHLRPSVAVLGSLVLSLGVVMGGCPSEPDSGSGAVGVSDNLPGAGGTGASGTGAGTVTNGAQPSGGIFSPAFVPNPSPANTSNTNTVVAGASESNADSADPLPGGSTPPSGDQMPAGDSSGPISNPAPVDPPPVPPPPPPPPAPPTLEVTPSELNFGTTTVLLPFQVRNAGSGTLSYQLVCESAWASVSVTEGESSGEYDTITVHCDRTWLVDYMVTYTTVITVLASNGQSATVTAQTRIPAPSFTPVISHAFLDFGTETNQISFTISNADPYPIPFTASGGDSWVRVDYEGASIPPAPNALTIHVTVDRCDDAWTTGVYVSDVAILPGGADSTPIVIPLQLEVPGLPGDAAVAASLAALPALPKKHYSYSTTWRMVDDLSSGLLYEYARITHTITLECIQAVHYTRVADAVLTCKQINATNPEIETTLVLKYSPYGYFMPKNVPPWYNGPEVQQELDQLTAKLTAVKSLWQAANALHATNVRIDTIILNTELWRAKLPGQPGAAEWNEASRQKYDAAYAICKAIFPDAVVHWYNRGKPIERGGYFTFAEQGDVCSVETYYTYNLPTLRQRYRNGYLFAQTIGEIPIPWIDLNGGFYELPNGDGMYLCGVDHPEINSWQLGHEINFPGFVPPPDHNPPLNVSPEVALYPGIFTTKEPEFAKHFVAYVKGAANIPLGP